MMNPNKHTAMVSSIKTELKSTLDEWKIGLDASLAAINDSIKSVRSDLEAYIKDMKNDIEHLRSENTTMKTSVNKLTEEVAETIKSAHYISRQFDEQGKRLAVLEERASSPNIINALDAKIENLKQQARQCNVEIANIPEKRGENLLTLIENIGKTINCSI